MNEMKKICGDCKTTKTPLWRSGHYGPRSLCNACGIRYRKRKMSDDEQPSSEVRKESKSDYYVDDNQSSEMGFNYSDMGNEEIVQGSFSSSKMKKQRSSNSEESISSQRNLGEVEQAALLLMYLSCAS